MSELSRTTAQLIVECLENEGVTHVFGIPGEENIRFTEAVSKSSIEYVLTRHEQGASFMAEVYGRLTGKAGVCSATLGPGAINLLLGVADAHQGRGIGSALLRTATDRCDAAGEAAYLEATNLNNRRLYERHGFVVTAELVLPDGGPSVWAMWRDPRS